MRKIFPPACAGAIFFALIAIAAATATYDYKRGELLTIKGGKSPDKKYSIVSGENNKGQFGVYLMDAQSKKLIGQLEEVATDLDSAPDAYRALWAPDSKHVGISSRADRHVLVNVIYRIENRRAYVVETPQLRCHAVPKFCEMEKELKGEPKSGREEEDDPDAKVRQTTDTSEITKWLSPTRFLVSEEAQFQIKERDPTSAVGKYGEVEKEDAEPGEPARYHVWLEADGECELLPNDKSRVLSTHPVEKKKEND
jgi:hypothetical protein